MNIEMPVTLKMGDLMSEDEFFQFCQMNDTLEFERDSERNITVKPLKGSSNGNSNLRISMEFFLWNKMMNLGKGFGSSTGFTLPNGAVRSPQFAWIKTERWDTLTQDEKERFAPISPDFVLEIRSKFDDLKYLRDKMEEYISNGTRLGWLIDHFESKVYIYNTDKPVVVHDTLNIKLSGESVLPGFVLDLGSVIE